MSNLLTNNKEFEQNPSREIEQKFVPIFPEQLDKWREQSLPIEQLYLSHPSEPFSLRLRESFDSAGKPRYTATLKDTGEMTGEGLDRLEIETEVSAETYALYRGDSSYPVLRKLRASPMKNIDIDYYEDGSATLESEHPISLSVFLDRHPIALDDRTGDRSVDNTHRAHFDYRKRHNGAETLRPAEQSDSVMTLARDIYRYHIANKLVVATIHGRSGSGKSTLVREIAHELEGTVPRIITLSTDDYHIGKTALEAHNNGEPWQNWDDEIVYNLEALAADIKKLNDGELVERRRFNFNTEEPELIGTIEPVNERTLILLEGIYAGSVVFSSIAHVRHEVQTPLATSIGRRLKRDFSGERVNDSLSNPGATLRYMLENAEPAYQAQRTGTTR
jgi:uridine kinase